MSTVERRDEPSALEKMESGGADADVAENGAPEAPASPSKAAGPSTKVPVQVIIGASICSSVSLILVNKIIMHTFGFRFVMVLTTLHFLCTWGALAVCAAGGVFTPVEPATIPVSERLKVAAAGVCSIVFMNLSLQHNSVGTYQMLKLACIPTVMIIEYVRFQTVYSAQRQIALFILLVGVGIATVTDVQMRMVGLAFGAVAVLTTAQFQMWQGSKQREFAASPLQLLYALVPYQALVTFGAACIFERGVVSHSFHDTELLLILVSGAIAVSVNLCSMALIGKTSAVVYQVVGHTKTCLILLGGFVLVPGAAEMPAGALAKNLGGIAVAMGGVFRYSYLRTNGL